MNTNTANKIRNTMMRVLKIHAACASTPPKPRTASVIAITRNTIAHAMKSVAFV